MSETRKEAWIFISFLGKVHNSLLLALLATIRKHDVQTNMMLRQALESDVLACYALSEPVIESFTTEDQDGLLSSRKDVRTRAYKWLEEEYEDHSVKIKHMKDVINESSAHSDIMQTPTNYECLQDMMWIFIFDKDDEHSVTKQRLWWIANIAFGLIDLFSIVAKKCPLIDFVDDFAKRMSEYGSDNRKWKTKLMSDPRFDRFKKK